MNGAIEMIIQKQRLKLRPKKTAPKPEPIKEPDSTVIGEYWRDYKPKERR